MGRKPNTFTEIKDAEDIVAKLCAKYPDVLWQVSPKNVIVMGIENKERNQKKNKILAKIRSVRGSTKAVMEINRVPVRHIIEMYWSDWNEWKERFRQWVLMHELLHISHEEGKAINHDSEDFKILLDVVGVNWSSGSEHLPDLINDKVEFKLDLRPGLPEEDEEEGDVIEDEDEPEDEPADKKEGEDNKI